MSYAEYQSFINARGRKLKELLMPDVALSKNDALEALSMLSDRSAVVLGVDIVNFDTDGSPHIIGKDAYYVARRKGESFEQLAERSLSEAAEHIRETKEENDVETRYVLITCLTEEYPDLERRAANTHPS